MEVRLNNHGQNLLSTKVFFSDESGFAVASVIVMGETDAVLLDAQWSLSNGHRVAAEILETGRNLKTIYVTHAHPDHYFGLGPIVEAFPGAKVVALPEVASTINKQMFGKIDHWRDIIGRTNVPTIAVKIEPLTDNHFELEGQRIEIISKIMGDLKYNTVVWIPSIKTLYGSDVLFNQAHPFTCEITAEERRQWYHDIERIEGLGAEVVIPGHQKPGMPFDSSCYKFMKDYLIATEEELENTTDTGSFFYAMALRFPDANLLFLSNEMNAAVFKGGRDWEWRD
ncbi:MAG: MBL fold metallo-hydrolase [Desulfatiglandaceae bacterium]|jgi:glyoxylase-like metal-dependent hydrolase (beta-lactamase superfamily II)